MSRVLAGPWATQLLADLGADVIKIERPGAGDDTRGWGPPWFKGEDGARESAYFTSANRGKRSIAIDITSSAGGDLVRRMASEADVFVENYKVGALARFGLDPASLQTLNPCLVYCSISGFGQDGPYAAQPGYDFVVQAMGGLMSLTGDPPGEPMKAGVALTDILTGLYASNGILAALIQRQIIGTGQRVEVSLLDVQIAAMTNQAAAYLATGQNPERWGNAHPSIVPYQSFATADGVLAVAVGNDGQFRQLCHVLGCGALANDPRFTTNAGRVDARDTLIPILQDHFARRGNAAWTEALLDANVPVGPVNRLSDVFADPHVQARGVRIATPHATLGSVAGIACPIRLSASPVRYDRGPPVLDEHGESIRRTYAAGREG